MINKCPCCHKNQLLDVFFWEESRKNFDEKESLGLSNANKMNRELPSQLKKEEDKRRVKKDEICSCATPEQKRVRAIDYYRHWQKNRSLYNSVREYIKKSEASKIDSHIEEKREIQKSDKILKNSSGNSVFFV